MLRDLINTKEITRWSKDWNEWYEKYESVGLENMRGQFLLRKNRRENPVQFLNDIACAHQKAQARANNFYQETIFTILAEAQKRAKDGKVILHACPTHKYELYKNHNWWKYEYRISNVRHESGYTFDWIPEPEEKLNHDLGQKLYEAEQKIEKLNRRQFILCRLLERELEKYLYSLYSWHWLRENQFSEKLVKFNLRGDEYWYKIGRSREAGAPIWENFIWQNSKTEEINL